MENQYLTTAEAAAVLSIAPATLKKWRVRGVGPRYYRPEFVESRHSVRSGCRVVRYAIADLHKWMRSGDSADREIDRGAGFESCEDLPGPNYLPDESCE